MNNSITKNLQRILFLFIWSLMALTLLSCGGGGSDEEVTWITGQFVDDPVQGLNYSCSSGSSGVTNSNGEYVCNAGDTVTFSLGSVVLGSVLVQQAAITPYSLFPDNVDAAINIARLLQTLDADGDPGNGVILIDAVLVNLLPATVDFESPTFASDIETALSGTGTTLISVIDALTQLNLNDPIINSGNHSPVADAGPDQAVTTGAMVTLNGSASSDQDGNPLSYAWSLVSTPAGSAAGLQNAFTQSATFTADVAGAYTLNLIVYDGLVANLDTVVITATVSDNADLAALALESNTLSPAFDPATTSYTVTVANAIDTVTITPTADDAGATISISGLTLVSGSPYTPIGTLAVGSNPFNLLVTAADGITTKTYTLTVIREVASSNADLSGLVLAGSALSPSFDAATTSYTATVANAIDTVTITPTSDDAGATISTSGLTLVSGSPYTPIGVLAVGSNQFNLLVTAADGTTTKTYTLTVTREAASSNADLSGLVLAGSVLSPSFDAATTSYTATVMNAIDTVTITPTSDDAGATISISGLTLVSGSPYTPIGTLAVGSNPFNLLVTAADGITTKTYTLTVIREVASSNADLSGLVLAGSALSPSFDAATTSYTATVANAIDTVTITPTSDDAGATISISGFTLVSGSPYTPIGVLAVGSNPFNLLVTAADGTTTKTYTLTVTREAVSSNADLSALVLAETALSPVFDATTTSYTATVGNAIESVTVTATTADTDATILHSGFTIGSGIPKTLPILGATLQVGPNEFPLTVTAADGTPKTYTLTVTREEPVVDITDATLQNLTFGPIVPADILTPTFNSTFTGPYTATVDNIYASITIIPTATNSNSTITVFADGREIPVNSGFSSGTIGLTVGNNAMSVRVVAPAGNSEFYSLTVIRTPVSTDANLSGLSLSEGLLAPDFDAYTNQYDTTVLYAVYSMTVTPTTANEYARVTVNGTAVDSGVASTAIPLSVGDNTITVEVTAEDGSTIKTYTITVTRQVLEGSSDAELSSLVLSDGVLSPFFNASTIDYLATVVNEISTFTVTPTTSDANATVTVNGVTVTSGAASAAIALTVGINVIDVVVTAEDGFTVISYSINMTRQAPPAPLGLRTTSVVGQITLSWNAVTVADSYTVYWNTTGNVTTADNSLDPADSTEYIHTGLNSGTTYYYRVSASNSSAEGELSAEVSSTQYPSDWQWRNSLPQGNNLNDIAWDGSQFIAVGGYGTILSSTDGQTWNIIQNSGTTMSLTGIIWDGDSSRFVAVGSSGTILTSPDGISWTSQNSGTTNGLSDIIWNGSQYVAVGY